MRDHPGEAMAGMEIDEEEWAAHLGAGLILCCFERYEQALSSLVRCHQLALHSGSQGQFPDQCRVDVAARALCEAVGEICLREKEPMKARTLLIPHFQRYYSCSISAQAWSAFFIGYSSIESKLASHNGKVQWLKHSLDLAARSPDSHQMCYIECSANHLLFRLTPERECQTERFHHLKMWKEAATRLGKLEEEVFALFNYFAICYSNDQLDETVQTREQLSELVRTSDDALLQAMSECSRGRTAQRFAQREECLEFAMRVVSRLDVPRLRAPLSWSSYFGYCATPGFKSPSSPTRDRQWFECLADALLMIVLARGGETETVMALAALAKYKQLMKVGVMFLLGKKLLYLSRLCNIYIDLYNIKGEKWSDRAESVLAKTLELSSTLGEWLTYMETLFMLVKFAEYPAAEEPSFEFYSQRGGPSEVMNSLLAEAERLARQHNFSCLSLLSYSRAYFLFRMQDMDEVIEILVPLGKKLLENSYKIGSFSRDRILYSDVQSDVFEMLQAALITCQQPDQAIVWAERERAQDLLHSINIAQASEEEPMDFNQSDEKAMEEIESITRDAGEDTAFLVYTSIIGAFGVCGFLLHQTVKRAWFTKFEQRLDIPADVQRITDSLHEKNIDFSLTRLQEWYKHLISPIETDLEKIQPRKLVIIPGKHLCGLPFAALYKGPGEPFLIEKHAISYIPSLRMYAHCKHRGEALMANFIERNYSAVVIGNPATALAGDLPFADEEAEATKDLLEEAGFQDIKLLRKDQATKFAVLESLPAADWVHYAGHAVVSSNFPHGALLLAPENSANAGGQQGEAAHNEAAGLGVPSSHNEGKYDGNSRETTLLRYAQGRPSSEVLTGDDIESRKVKVRALVTVLSACQSGFGEVLSEGVLGMYRALHVAGAPSVLCSLWNLNDECTKSFMEKLYKKLLEGSELAMALQEVMVESIDDNIPLQDWAAFIISGNPEMKLMRTVRKQ